MQKEAYAARVTPLVVEEPQVVPNSEEGAEFPLSVVFTWPCLPQIRNELRCYALELLGSTSEPWIDPTWRLLSA